MRYKDAVSREHRTPEDNSPNGRLRRRLPPRKFLTVKPRPQGLPRGSEAHQSPEGRYTLEDSSLTWASSGSRSFGSTSWSILVIPLGRLTQQMWYHRM
jgi:hypothetical protein